MNISESYEKYKQERLEREKEQQAIKQFQADAKAQTDAYYKNKTPKIHVTRKNHVCAKCNQTIPAGSHTTTRLIVKDGNRNLMVSNGHFETLYYCLSCKPLEVPA
jgi:ribosomal protein S27AE